MWTEIYIAFILISTVLFLTLRSYFSAKSRLNKIANWNEITVIVPFRNESQNLDELFHSLNKQTKLPNKVIFVNDHSDDDGLEKVEQFCSSNETFSWVSLKKGQSGKKKAIEAGVLKASTRYILTLDADTRFENTLFESLRIDQGISMVCGPVLLESRGLSQYFYSLEHLFFNSFNFFISPFYTLSASGANLIFKREDYIQFNAIESHQELLSGDDHFLLRNFQSNGLRIKMTNDSSNIVYTDAPKNFKTYLDQRVRWLGKTTKKTTLKELLFGIYISVYIVLGPALTVYSLIHSDYESAIMILVFRFVLDAIILLIYVIPLKRINYVWTLPFFQVFYPFIYLIVLMGSLVYRPSWKGRKVK